MFGEPTLYRDVRAIVIPLLRTYPFVRIWSAGCATGEDTYALAIALLEEGIYERCRVYATDAVDALLDAAREGAYDAEMFEEWQRSYAASGGGRSLAEYVSVDGPRASMRPEIKRNIVFAQHNIVSDGSFNEFHLVFCPGMLRQFNKELQSRAFGVLRESLVRLGYLALGRDESIATSQYAQAFRKVESDAAIYRRIG